MLKMHVTTTAAALLLGLVAALPARADTVMLEQAGLVSGRQSFVVPMSIDSRGQMSVQLSDLGWAGKLADLSFTLSGANGLIAANPAMAAANSDGLGAPQPKTYTISEPGAYYATISGKAVGPYNLGLYGIRVGFASLDAPAVPLPGAVWLLLGGLGVLGRHVHGRSRCS